MSNAEMDIPISNEEHKYNAFRIEVLESKILMLEKKIIEMNNKNETNVDNNYNRKIFGWTSTITSIILLLMMTDLYSKYVSQ
jgi:hypothetical protein